MLFLDGPKVAKDFDEGWSKARLYVSSVESIFKHMSSRKRELANNLDVATLNLKLGLIYMEIFADCKSALSYTKIALSMMQTFYKEDHLEVAYSLNYLGIVYQNLGYAKLGLTYSNSALKMRQALYKGGHPDIANSLNNLGVIWRALGDAKLGIAYCKQALEMRQVLYPGGHHQLISSFNNMGLIYKDLKDYDNSLIYYKYALKMKQVLYKGSHRYVANSINAVGQAYEKLGYVERALDYNMRALYMQQALNLGNHPDIVNSLNSVGQAYEKLGDVKKGLLYYQQALQMNQVLYSGYHLVIAGTFDTVGAAYYKLNDIRNSILHYEQALKIKQAFYKCHHSDIASSLNTIGIAYEKLGNIKKGLSYYKQALEMRLALSKGNHPEVATYLNAVGSAYEQLGDINGGLLFYKQAMKMSQALYKGNHPDVATFLNNVGNSYAILGNIHRGIEYQEQALRMRRALYQDNHLDVVTSLNNVGVAYYKLGNIENGIVYQEQALKILQALQTSGLIIAIAFNNVAAVYKDLGDIGKYSICNKLAASSKGFVNKRGFVTKDIINVKLKLQNKVLNTIQTLSANGVWSNKKGPYNYGVLGYLRERYLIKRLGGTGNVHSLSTARSLCFEAISIGITNSKWQDPTCAVEFAKLYPNLISVIAEEHPEYFVIEAIAEACLSVEEYRKVTSQSLKATYQSQEFKGEGILCYAGKSYYEYYNTAVDKILEMRLIDLKVKRLDSWYLGEDLIFIGELAYKVSDEFLNNEIEVIVAPYNLNEHWLGLLFRKLENVVEVVYLDSEQEELLPWIKQELEYGLSANGYKSRFLKLVLEKQRYNNCGPELVENFVYYLTGTRPTQESAVYLHSLLLENSLLDPIEYGLKIKENNELIRFLSNTGGFEIMELPLLSANEGLNSEVRVVSEAIVVYKAIGEQELNLVEGFLNKLATSLYCKKLLYRQELKKFADMIGEYEIELSSGLTTVDVLLDNSKFNKLVMNRIHPDKNPFGEMQAHKDTLFVMDIRDKLAEDLKLEKLLEDSLVKINSFLHKSSIGFKALDIVVDSARLAYEPSMDQAKKLALDYAHLYGLMVGANGYSLAISGAEAAYQLYKGEYQKAFDVAAGTLSAMAIPIILAHVNRPYLGFICGLFTAANTIYNALENAYSFALELAEGSQGLGIEFIVGQALDFVDNDATVVKAL